MLSEAQHWSGMPRLLTASNMVDYPIEVLIWQHTPCEAFLDLHNTTIALVLSFSWM